MQKFRTFSLLLAFSLLFSLAGPGAQALEEPERLSAQAVLLVDLDSGLVLYERNADQQRSPASLTKIMTILLALEAAERGEVSLDDPVTAGPDCRSGMRDDSSSVGIRAGEQMSLRHLLYCAAVASGNDACNVIAAYLAGSIPGFVERMNARAAELGCSQTHFVDPNGLSYDDLTSARDLYLITREALRHPAFRELCDTRAYTVPATNQQGERQLKSSNALIAPDGFYGAGYLYEGAHGVKTGYTRAAGYCLISTAERNGMRLLAIVLGCDGPLLSGGEEYRNFSDTIRLYDWAFAHFSRRSLLQPELPAAQAEIAFALGDPRVGLLPVDELSLPLPDEIPPGSEDLRIQLFDGNLIAPVRAGEVLGQAQLYRDGTLLATVLLVADRSVPRCYWDYIAHFAF